MNSDNARKRNRPGDQFFAIPWRHIAIGASLVAVALVVGTGIALGVSDLDALTTTALVLAVVAFVTQLIMFVASSWTSSQQMLQSQTLNAETSRLMSDTRSTLQEMSAIAGERFDRLMDRALGDTRDVVEEEVVSTSTSPEEAATTVARYEALLRNYITSAGTRHLSRRASLSSEDEEIIRQLRTYPKDPAIGRQIVRQIEEVDAASLIILNRMASSELAARQVGRPAGAWLFADKPSYTTLLERGLIEKVSPSAEIPHPRDFGERPYESCRLTAAGREVGRFFTAREITPDYLWD